MKPRLLILFALCFCLAGCKEEEKDDKNTGNENIALSQFIIDNYSADAKQLYLDEIMRDSLHENFNNPIIDEAEVTNILKIIQAVYDSHSTERDTVFDIYQIHGYYCYGFNAVDLRVNTESPAIKNLATGIIPTGDVDLDRVLTTYAFDSVKVSYSYPRFPWLSVFTKKEYNMFPIVKEFDVLDNITAADFSRGCAGDGNSIDLKRGANAAIIAFSIGRGDCPAGCIYHRYWEFKVENGTAEFVRAYRWK